MQLNTVKSKENKLLDIFKYVCAVLVLGSHCLPIVSNTQINFLYGQWFFRFCVPFFIISSGYFFASFSLKAKKKYIKRIVLLYIIAALLYLSEYIELDTNKFIRTAVFGYRHLWYLSALAISLILLYVFEQTPFIKRLFNKIYPYVAVILIVIGAYFDEYKFIFKNLSQSHIIKRIDEIIEYIGGSRHALFFSLPMLLIGKFIYEHRDKIKLKKARCILLTIFSFGVSLTESIVIRHFSDKSITCDVTLFNYLPAVFLFILTLVHTPKLLENVRTKSLRKSADILYIIHIMVMLYVDKYLEIMYVKRFLLILLISMVISWLYVKIVSQIKALVKN